MRESLPEKEESAEGEEQFVSVSVYPKRLFIFELCIVVPLRGGIYGLSD